MPDMVFTASRVGIGLAVMAVLIMASAVISVAGTFVAFGPQDFVRERGKPGQTTTSFDVINPAARYTLRIHNGGQHGDYEKASSAVITLNGVTIARPQDFKQTVSLLETSVTLSAANVLVVELRSKPDSGVTIDIVGVDNDPPVITATTGPPTNTAGWHRSPVTVAFSCSDAISSIATCPAPVTVTTEGANQLITGTAIDLAGNEATVAVTLNIDQTPPDLAITSPADGHWQNDHQLMVQGTAGDALSGIHSVICNTTAASVTDGSFACPMSLHKGHNDIVVQATDLAGNSKVASITVSLDTGKPTITASLDPPPNAAGWHCGPVAVSFTCSDTMSGIASCSKSVTIEKEGAGQIITGTAVDLAGNKATVDITLNIDTTPPTVSAHVDPPPNANGWNHTSVTVRFDATDDLSGIAAVTAPIPVTTEGANQEISGTATAVAGNTASASTAVNVDLTAPVVTISAPADGAILAATDVMVTGTINSEPSGLARVTCNSVDALVTSGSFTCNLSFGESIHDIVVEATDLAGNVGTTTTTVTVDTTPPTLTATIEPPANARGWNNTDVTVSFNATDNLSGIQEVTEPVVLTADGDQLVVTGTATDRAGNVDSIDVVVRLDKTAPGVVIVSPPDSALLNIPLQTVTGTLSEALSGIAEVTCNGVAATVTDSTFSCALSLRQGANDIVVQATDMAGNVGTAAVGVSLDTIPPVVTITAPVDGSFTNQTPVMVTGTVDDDTATVRVNNVPATVNAGVFTADIPLLEGDNPIIATATDPAGNVGNASIAVTLDTVLPTLTAIVTPPANAAGWHRTAVTVSFEASDDSSGLLEVTDPIPIATEGANQVVTGSATDRAGNTRTLDVTLNIDLTPPTVTITAPADGHLQNDPQLKVEGSVDGAIAGVASVTCNGVGATVTNGVFHCDLTLSEGNNTIDVLAIDAADNEATAGIAVTLDTIPPVVTILSPPDNAVIYDPQVQITGTIDDNAAQLRVNGQVVPISDGQWTVDVPLDLGDHTLTVEATDPAGNSSQQALHLTRQEPVLERTSMAPVAARLTEVGATQPLTVTGTLSNGATQDLSAADTGTTYASSNPFVATVSPDGVVTALTNGSTVITARHDTFSATADITVEVGVLLQALDLLPAGATLRTSGASQQLRLQGTFSDGSIRDLTSADTGTVYTTDDPDMATVSDDGLVTAVANGTATITAANETLAAQAQINVAISSGTGFLRGEVYDDRAGLPLAQATATLLADGSGPLDILRTTTADTQGQFLLSGLQGDALVRVDKAGFISVERRGSIHRDTALTLLDARLTPLDPAIYAITSAGGGAAHSSDGDASLTFPPGSVPTDMDIRLTAISNQGLQGRLPLGWSPIAAVDVHPGAQVLGQPALLRVPNTLNLTPGSDVTLAAYDTARHQWLAQPPAHSGTRGGIGIGSRRINTRVCG